MWRTTAMRSLRWIAASGDCIRTRARLLDYELCRPSLPPEEREAVDAHLARCPACRRERDHLRAGLDFWGERLFSSPYASDPAADTGLRAGPLRARVRPRTRRLAVAAAWAIAALVALVAPVLALLNDKLEFPAARHTPPVAANAGTNVAGAPAFPTRPAGEGVALPPAVEGPRGLTGCVDAEFETLTALARVEVGLAREDAGDAWARREFPHILWLYDALLGKDVGPLDIPGGDGVHAVLYLDLAEGDQTWDGHPVDIPEWARSLYAEVPETQRPTGWRALLVYSGEIFRFDYPDRSGLPNVRPYAEAVLRAARVAGRTLGCRDACGRSCGFDFPPPPKETVSWSFPVLPAGYGRVLAADPDLGRSTLTFLYRALGCVGVPAFSEAADRARDPLAALVKADESACPTREAQHVLERYLAGREQLIRARLTLVQPFNSPDAPAPRR